MICVCEHAKSSHPETGGCNSCGWCLEFVEYVKLTEAQKDQLLRDAAQALRATGQPCRNTRDRYGVVCTYGYLKDKPDQWCEFCKASEVRGRLFASRYWNTPEELEEMRKSRLDEMRKSAR